LGGFGPDGRNRPPQLWAKCWLHGSFFGHRDPNPGVDPLVVAVGVDPVSFGLPLAHRAVQTSSAEYALK